MIIYDFEVLKHDWMIVWLDTETRKMHSIVNDKEKFAKFYEYYKHRIWVGYNSRSYDTWIAKAILCGFNPYEMSKWIIEKKRKGHEFSKLLYNYPIIGYDTIYGFKSLKELEGYMGHDIRESSVPFDIDRPLNDSEIKEMLEYCRHDVMETFHVFVESSSKYSAHVGLVNEFGLDPIYINKTPAQLSAIILGAVKEERNDEFDIKMPDTLRLGKYEYILDHFMNWATNVRDYEKIGLDADIMDVPHTFGVGGIHGARKQYHGEGFYVMADVDSYYPQGMIQYKYLSRNVKDPSKFVKIRDNRLILKAKKDPRQESLKLVINGTFGASKDKYNNLYDPLQANNLCISNQLFLVDLLDKLDGHCELIQSNTDGILVKLYNESDLDKIKSIIQEWSDRTGFKMSIDIYKRVFQKDVNNYIIEDENGKCKSKGSYVKKLTKLDYDLPIVNRAIFEFLINGIDPRVTIYKEDKLMEFQKIIKISSKYDYGFKENIMGNRIDVTNDKETRTYFGARINEKVNRCFATTDFKEGTILKKHGEKSFLDKVANVPDKCVIINTNVEEEKVPNWLDRDYYVDLAKSRINDFIGKIF